MNEFGSVVVGLWPVLVALLGLVCALASDLLYRQGERRPAIITGWVAAIATISGAMAFALTWAPR